MADPGHEKTWESNDPVVGANSTANDEPVAPAPLERVGSEKDLNSPSTDSFSVDEDHEKEKQTGRPSVERAITTATSASGYTEAESESPKKVPWSRRLNPLRKNHPPPPPKERIVCREYSANLLSKMTWQWISPLMATGYQRPLENNDIWLVNPDRSVNVLGANLMTSFEKRLGGSGKRPLLGAMYDTFKRDFLIGGLCQLTSSVVQVISPYTLRYLITFAEDAYVAKARGQPPPSVGKGVGLIVAILCLQIIQSQATNHFIYRGMLNGGQARAVMISVIFDKAMKLSGRAKAGGKAVGTPPPEIQPGTEEEKRWYKKILTKKQKEAKGGKGDQGMAGDGRGWSNGRIINLMSTDTYRIDQASGMFHMIWTAPIQIAVCLALLIVNLSYSALAGFALLVISMPILGKSIRSLFRRRIAINKITDQRVSLTQEILQAVRFVKYFGWETSFLDRLDKLRKREIWSIQVLLAIRNAINAVSMSMPVFAGMLAFVTYSLSNHVLNPAPIFSSLALFNSLRLPLNFLPLVIGQVIDAYSSVNRIQEFLMAEEAEDDAEWNYDAENAVVLHHGDFTWERTKTQEKDDEPSAKGPPGRGPPGGKPKQDKKAKKKKKGEKPNAGDQEKPANGVLELEDEEKEPFKLHDINLTVGRNELLAVIGTVGSGKSSLLAALAGDMRRTNGELTLGASRAFCPQYAWIQNATVKHNIVFGREVNRGWYDRVVDACALRPDFEMLPNGDMTEIGERGITVSGGQKQRLNIARAIYFNADMVLMDDPLSAVDAHVGRHIMDNAICGLLKDKCRILATHQLHVLNRCDRIVVMHEGRISAIDTFDNLMDNNADFIALMKTTASEEGEKKDVEVVEDVIEDEKKVQNRRKKKKSLGLMQQEERAVASVDWDVWAAYIKATGSWLVAPLILILLFLSQASNMVTSLWLSWWTSNKFGYSEGVYIGVYAALGFSQCLTMFLFSVFLSYFGTTASKVMLRRSITRVLRAPMSFFDTTPLGRITNRFSKDIDIMDNNLTDSFRMAFMTQAMIISVFVLIIAYFHYFAIALGPLAVFFVFAANYYRSSAREIKRHESVLRSSVFSRFSEAISGTATIRAYGLQNQFSRSVREAIDDMDSAYFLTFANQRWLSVRLDAIGNILVFVTGILVVTSRFSVNPSTGGLVLSYILSIVQMIQFTVRQFAEVENNMNATERIHYYGTQIDEEPPLHLGQVPSSWPEKGEIVFDNVSMRYREGLPLVLRDVSIRVKSGERIGVVGRTGAGKSSIMSTLFRLVEISGGSISIDGTNISTIGLHDLRSRLAIIPQDPTLFRGTIRSNLDPFNEHTDLGLWSALRQADLVGATDTMDDKTTRINLESIVEEEGLNYSLGQRQLMALARALVRGSQIIVCDEATSSVDFETDQKIQRTIVEGFKGKTLLCIAHRLKTIIGYDRICVMDNGQIAELDSPLNLYDMGGIFRGMCDKSKIQREEILEEMSHNGKAPAASQA